MVVAVAQPLSDNKATKDRAVVETAEALWQRRLVVVLARHRVVEAVV